MKFYLFLLSLVFEIPEYRPQGIYDKPVPEIIEYYGYPSETHSVFTEDGFNLILHRIPYGRRCKEKSGMPVLLLHGIFQSSLSYLYLGPERSLGFLLADDCYDVWLGNSRGNCYSREHKYLNRNQAKYWDFSNLEPAVYDISAAVDYMTKITKQDGVFFVGVSQGSTLGLIYESRVPESKIKAHFLMAPVSYLLLSPSPGRLVALTEPVITSLTILLGNFEFGLDLRPVRFAERIVCSVAPDLCSLPFGFCGYDPAEYNKTAESANLLHSCPTSSKQILHFLQGFMRDFEDYNYGPINLEKYGTLSPPKYRVEAIKKPIYLYHARKDLCADLADVERLVEALGNNVVKNRLVDSSTFEHLSFSFSVQAKELVYDLLLSDMNEALKKL